MRHDNEILLDEEFDMLWYSYGKAERQEYPKALESWSKQVNQSNCEAQGRAVEESWADRLKLIDVTCRRLPKLLLGVDSGVSLFDCSHLD